MVEIMNKLGPNAGIHSDTQPRGAHFSAFPVAPWPRGFAPVRPGVGLFRRDL